MEGDIVDWEDEVPFFHSLTMTFEIVLHRLSFWSIIKELNGCSAFDGA
jgi:hypothetical protein